MHARCENSIIRSEHMQFFLSSCSPKARTACICRRTRIRYLYFFIEARIADLCIDKYNAVLQENMAEKNAFMNIISGILKHLAANPGNTDDNILILHLPSSDNIGLVKRGGAIWAIL